MLATVTTIASVADSWTTAEQSIVRQTDSAGKQVKPIKKDTSCLYTLRVGKENERPAWRSFPQFIARAVR